jgi:hypothetical protein
MMFGGATRCRPGSSALGRQLSMRFARASTRLALALCLLGCGDGEMTEPPVSGEVPRPAEPIPGPPGACTIAPTCLDIDVPPLAAAACCTPVSSCGYIVPELDPETLMHFPDAQDLRAMLTKDDPNGRCAPDSIFFGPQEGLAEERWEEEGVVDILIAPGCSSYHLANFTVMGCCLPGNTCGLSTHANWDTFAVLANDPSAPFARPECVPSEVLNQQFRASTLGAFARTIGGGTCNYAEIDARQPNRLP